MNVLLTILAGWALLILPIVIASRNPYRQFPISPAGFERMTQLRHNETMRVLREMERDAA